MSTASLEPDYSLEDVATAMGMSVRWVRQRIAEGAEHQRYGHKIRFTAAQVERLRAQFTKDASGGSVTTGRKKRAT